MTVTYSHEVADARFCGFSRLLGRWRGSIYQIFYKEFILYIVLYMILSVLYRFILSPEQRKTFENICLEFHQYTGLIPVAFVLGFYVTVVVGRWWNQFILIPFPDRVMYLVVGNLHGADSRGRMMRRTLMRYLNLSQLIVYQAMSTSTRRRFPNLESFLRCGAMTKHEYADFKAVNSKHLKYWVPLVWFSNLLSKAKMEGRIVSDITYNQIMEEMMQYRSGLGMLLAYDWVTLPLVYTQVVTLAVYSYFASTLLGRQFLDRSEGHHVDMVVPYFTICEFFFYMGLLKVAEVLINPFGEDDDDFNLNEIIDRNMEVPMLAVDNLYGRSPRLTKDHFWDSPNPEMPYAPNTQSHQPFTGSTCDMRESRADLGKTRPMMEPLDELDENGNNKEYVMMSFQDNQEFIVDGSDLMDVGVSFGDLDDQDLLSNIDDEDTVDANSSEEDIDPDAHDTLQSEEDSQEESVHSAEKKSRSSNERMNQQQSNQLQQQSNLAESGSLLLRSSDAEPKTKKIGGSNQGSKQNVAAGKANRRMTRNQRDSNLQKRIIQQHLVATTEDDSDRENIYKRMQIQGRNKRLRSISDSQRMQKRALLHSHYPRIASPDQSVLSGFDSPFGSVASFATSVPSPKQLRWAFRPNRTSISGNDTNSDMSSSLSFSQTSVTGPRSPGGRSNRARNMSESSAGGDHTHNRMVFHDEVLRRLQVVSKPKITRSQDSINEFQQSPRQQHVSFNTPVDDVTVVVNNNDKNQLVTTSHTTLAQTSNTKRSMWATLRSRFADNGKKRAATTASAAREQMSDPEVGMSVINRGSSSTQGGNPKIVISEETEDVKAPLIPDSASNNNNNPTPRPRPTSMASSVHWERETKDSEVALDITEATRVKRPDQLDITTTTLLDDTLTSESIMAANDDDDDDVIDDTSRDVVVVGEVVVDPLEGDVDMMASFTKLDPIPENRALHWQPDQNPVVVDPIV